MGCLAPGWFFPDGKSILQIFFTYVKNDSNQKGASWIRVQRRLVISQPHLSSQLFRSVDHVVTRHWNFLKSLKEGKNVSITREIATEGIHVSRRQNQSTITWNKESCCIFEWCSAWDGPELTDTSFPQYWSKLEQRQQQTANEEIKGAGILHCFLIGSSLGVAGSPEYFSHQL